MRGGDVASPVTQWPLSRWTYCTPRKGVTRLSVISTAVTKTGQMTTGSNYGAQHGP
jgi:hypothetical protein